MIALGINLGFFLFQVFNFIIIALVLYALAYKPITTLLENRKRTIAQSLEDARIAADARSNAEEEAAKIIVNGIRKRKKIIVSSTFLFLNKINEDF